MQELEAIPTSPLGLRIVAEEMDGNIAKDQTSIEIAIIIDDIQNKKPQFLKNQGFKIIIIIIIILLKSQYLQSLSYYFVTQLCGFITWKCTWRDSSDLWRWFGLCERFGQGQWKDILQCFVLETPVWVAQGQKNVQ